MDILLLILVFFSGILIGGLMAFTAVFVGSIDAVYRDEDE